MKARQRRRRRSTGPTPVRTVSIPADLWSAVEVAVPPEGRSAFVGRAIRKPLLSLAAERLKDYYETDPEVAEWLEIIEVVEDEG
jgi:hypothetical protein